jgi:ABC-type nitrate/sulfonate/bicarbonate transport system substrate-binding protein
VSHNLQDIEIEKVYINHHDLIASLISFNVDAISAWEPMGYQTNLLSGPKVLNLGSQGVYQLSLNLISRNAYLEFAKDEPTRLLQAIDESIEWINSNPQKAQRMIASRLDMPANQIEWSWPDYVFRLSLGNSLLSNLQLQARWAIDSHLVTTPSPDFRKLFFKHPYQQVVAQRD